MALPISLTIIQRNARGFRQKYNWFHFFLFITADVFVFQNSFLKPTDSLSLPRVCIYRKDRTFGHDLNTVLFTRPTLLKWPFAPRIIPLDGTRIVCGFWYRSGAISIFRALSFPGLIGLPIGVMILDWALHESSSLGLLGCSLWVCWEPKTV